jgi:ABC-type multidrug transport system fused ATPase/permease subunit
MKSPRPSVAQKRLEAILERYRDKEDRPAAERRHLQHLWQDFVFPMRWRLVWAIIATLTVSLQPYVWTFITRFLIDEVLCVGQAIPRAELEAHARWIIILFFVNSSIHLSAVFFSWQYSYQITLVGQRVVFELRRALHEKLQTLPLSFYDCTQTGRLLSVVLDDVATIQGSVASIGVNLFTNLASMLVGAIIVCSLNWRMGLLVLVALPLYVVNFRYFRPRIREANIAARRATTALYTRVEERVTAIRTVKVFGRERAEARHFAESANNLARVTMYVVRLQNWQNIIATVVSTLATGGILYLGMRELQAGRMQIGQVLQFFTSAGFMFAPAVVLSDIAVEMGRVSVVLRRIFDLMEADPEPPDRPEALMLSEAKGDITFAEVTFTYPGDETPTLHGVSFAVPAGQQVAIMGPSGSGKSTLLYLLMRFYDPEAGTITLDGHDLCDLRLISLRDRITLVMQEPVIFSGSVAENIRYGHLGASDAEVERAARDADLHEFAMTLPDGYATVVGERGMSLSGGQRQRLALAASLLSRPSVLLLDDTTSALDPATEARVRETLNRLMRGRTCFVVSHRVSTALASDLVLVLEDGHVTQFGSPADLLAQEGLFRRVYEQQTQESAEVTG